jgi:acetyltransferase-like isoleucine patch superfamily enzyme
MLSLLLKYRERPTLGSLRWWKVWAKRCATAPPLLASILRLSKLRRKGASIDMPVFISPSVWNGKIANLKIGRGSFVGRVEMHLHDRICVGNNVVINDGVRLLTASHMVDDVDFRLVTGPIVIGDYAWIAIGAILLPGVSVGAGAVVGAGALITKDVPDYGIAVGNPARILGKSRSSGLRYNPLQSLATFEAWLGKNGMPEHLIHNSITG